MDWSLTDILALWGAIIATFLGGWTIYRDLVQRPRLDVGVSLMNIYPGEQEVVVWTLQNRGPLTMHVTHLAGYAKRNSWLRRRAIRLFGGTVEGRAFLFSFNSLHTQLPVEIGPLNSTSVHYPIAHADLPDAARFAATTADGREWNVPRKTVKSLMAKRAKAIAERDARQAESSQ